MGMSPEGGYGEAVGLAGAGVAVSVVTMITSSRVGAYKGPQAEAINRNPASTKSFLWIIVLPHLGLPLRTKRFSLSKVL